MPWWLKNFSVNQGIWLSLVMHHQSNSAVHVGVYPPLTWLCYCPGQEMIWCCQGTPLKTLVLEGWTDPTVVLTSS